MKCERAGGEAARGKGGREGGGWEDKREMQGNKYNEKDNNEKLVGGKKREEVIG